MSIFDEKQIMPMLIGASGTPFDSSDYLFELKWDGERCIAYLDPEAGTELRNKRNIRMLPKVPELAELHKQASFRCVLDGELMILKDGKPDFYEIQKRSLMSNQFRIHLLSKQYPATFIAFDILYYQNRDTTLLPLVKRNEYLIKAIRESDRLAISRPVENQGIHLYQLAKQQDLEGVVAKRKDSIYIQGKRTRDWMKIKNLKDDDFVVCGYICKENNMISIVLGQYNEQQQLIYKGHVTLPVGGESFGVISRHPRMPSPPFPLPSGNEDAMWISPDLVCTVTFMEYTPSGGMRQPVWKGLRSDKKPLECISIPTDKQPKKESL